MRETDVKAATRIESTPNQIPRKSVVLTRHSLKCAICNHPDRAAIEFDFLNWRNPGDLVKGYRFRGLSTIYRHAHATGLFAKRRLNLRFAMERIVERVNEVPVTANAVIRAARAVSRINDEGQWVDPPSRLIVEHVNSEQAGYLAAPSSATVGSGFSPDLSPAHDAASGHGSSRADKTSQETEFLSRAPRASRYHRDTSARDTTKISAGSARSSLRACQAGEGRVPSIAARDASAVSRAPVIFDKELLDEPSDSASCELPRINGKPPEPEVVLEIAPSLYGAVQARREAANVRLAPWSNPEWERLATAAQQATSAPQGQSSAPPSSTLPQASRQGTASSVPLPTPQKEQSVATSSSLLPQAAFDEPARSAERFASPATNYASGNMSFSTLPEAAVPNSASLALPHPAARENSAADIKANVATPSSLPPQAASQTLATACPEQGRGVKQSPRGAGPSLGSAGSTNPPFPFDPPPLRRWKPRRRF